MWDCHTGALTLTASICCSFLLVNLKIRLLWILLRHFSAAPSGDVTVYTVLHGGCVFAYLMCFRDPTCLVWDLVSVEALFHVGCSAWRNCDVHNRISAPQQGRDFDSKQQKTCLISPCPLTPYGSCDCDCVSVCVLLASANTSMHGSTTTRPILVPPACPLLIGKD